MKYESIQSLKAEKYYAKQNARELGYISRYPNIETEIESASSVGEIYRILRSARNMERR